jgi:glucokinase
MIDGGDEGGGLYLGVEIGGSKLQILAGNRRAEIVERIRLDVDPATSGAGIRSQIERAIPELARRHKPVAAGVGFGGPVDWKTGEICCSHQVEGWSDYPLAAWLSELAGAPVFVDNDANVGALGEAVHGAGAGFDTVFYVTLGSGVGGGWWRAEGFITGRAPENRRLGTSGWIARGRSLKAAVRDGPSMPDCAAPRRSIRKARLRGASEGRLAGRRSF